MNECESPPSLTVGQNNGVSHSYICTFLLMVLTAIGVYFCFRLTLPFLSALVWALALAVVFFPFHRWMELKVRHRNLATLASVLVVGLIVVVPAFLVGQRLVLQAAKGAELVAQKVESGDWRRMLEERPRVARLVGQVERHVDLAGTVQTLAAWLTNTAKSVVKGSVVQAISFLLSFYLLFFFLRDRRMALMAIRSLSPLSESEMDQLLVRIGDTICATIYGTLAVAALQGLLGGIMFWWLGLPSPLLWGVVMAVLSVVPVLGAFVVWIPATIFLLLNGSWGKALILAIWGAAVVSTIDNLLRPMLIGTRLKLHTVLAFMSMVGGVMLFGSAGLVLGPVILTITAELLKSWNRRAAERLNPSSSVTGRQRCSLRDPCA